MSPQSFWDKTMTISVQKIYSKGSGKLNEDELLIKDNVFATFDGASSLVKFVNKDGKTGGKLAAEITKEIFSKKDKPLNQLAIEANNRILKDMKKEGMDINQKEALWSVSTAAIRLNREEAEFFNIGDCFILVIFKESFHRLLIPYVDHDLETMIKWKKLAEKKVKDIWGVLKSQIEKVRREANIKYGCLNGQKEAITFFRYGRFKVENIKSIILFSDGLLIPKENPEQPENWGLFVKLYQEAGLRGILKYVRSLEKSDPNCWKYPRFKQHDDVAAIAIDFLLR